MKRLIPGSALFAAALTFIGCGDEGADPGVRTQEPAEPAAQAEPPRADAPDDRTWTTLSMNDFTPVHLAQLDTATGARDSLFGQLTRALMQAMATNGPAGAIDACRIEAPVLAARTSSDQNVRIGRTSWKIRNPANVSPKWAEAFLDERSEDPRFAQADDGTFGAFLPIRILPLCLTCHGHDDMIPADVRAEIVRLYPDDQATGFGSGDLRGWFWIEVPNPG